MTSDDQDVDDAPWQDVVATAGFAAVMGTGVSIAAKWPVALAAPLVLVVTAVIAALVAMAKRI